MEIISNEYKTITPHMLVRHGKVWLGLYEHAIKDGDAAAIFPGIYCLFSAAEMYLKAYIVLKISDYSNPEKLQTLGHNFNIMYEKLKPVASDSFARNVKNNLKRYHLFDLDINNLKYTEMSQFWSIDYGLEKGQHTFADIFKTIENEVDSGMDDWLKAVFPRETQIVVALQEDTKVKDVSQAQAKKWLALCPACRPKGVLIRLHISYPWALEYQPPRSCTKCQSMYQPDKDTSPDLYKRRLSWQSGPL